MKTMCPPGYHHNGFVTTHTLGHMLYGYKLLVIIDSSFRATRSFANITRITSYINKFINQKRLQIIRYFMFSFMLCLILKEVKTISRSASSQNGLQIFENFF